MQSSISPSVISPSLIALNAEAFTRSALSVITLVPALIARARVSAWDFPYLCKSTFWAKSPPSVTANKSPQSFLSTSLISGFISPGTPEISLYAAIMEYAPPYFIAGRKAA